MNEFETRAFQHGPLRFTALAQGSGPVVLCVHGFPDCARSYRAQLPVLAAAGYRAISVSPRGYEPDSIPANGDYSLETIATDVLAIIDQLGEEQVHLVGHDWGAAIAYTVAGMAPQRLHSLTAMAVPHPYRFLTDILRQPKQLRLSWYMLFFQLRGVADRIVARNDYQFIRMLWRQWSPGWEPPADELRAVIDTLRRPGVTRAALGYYRAALDPRSLPLTAAAREQAQFQVPVPTLALTGERDGCIDTRAFKAMMREEDFPAGLQVKQIARAGHFPHQEQPDEVNRLLLEWFEKKLPNEHENAANTVESL